MRNKASILIITLICLAMVAGCATVIKPVPAQDLNPKVKSGALVQKTNNFEVILDTSASMDEGYEFFLFTQKSEAADTRTGLAGTGTRPDPERLHATKLEYEQHLARLFNDTIPNLKLTAGLRDFAGRRWLSRNFDTKLWYGMSQWAKADLEKKGPDLPERIPFMPLEVCEGFLVAKDNPPDDPPRSEPAFKCKDPANVHRLFCGAGIDRRPQGDGPWILSGKSRRKYWISSIAMSGASGGQASRQENLFF